jgi:hypothetical protein
VGQCGVLMDLFFDPHIHMAVSFDDIDRDIIGMPL